jgi:acetyl-CoA decarbonylase/synthase complex subunit gamma
MRYAVVPGLYALGSPDRNAPVLVTANYKMTFDRLRRAVPGIDAWVLVLDTDGINVWCAAGKGTFGTDELVRRIADTSLDQVVDHRQLIVPQLGAPGVAAHIVARRTGFDVIWGPVMAEDLPAFLAAGSVELVGAAIPLLPIMAAILLLGGLGRSQGYWVGVVDQGITGVLALAAAAFAGTALTPLLLPWLPGRAFAVKGAVIGLPVVLATLALRSPDIGAQWKSLEMVGWLLVGTALSAFLAMNFTGASTYTSLSGVRKEMRFAVPLQIAAAIVGLIMWLGSLWLPGGGL